MRDSLIKICFPVGKASVWTTHVAHKVFRLRCTFFTFCLAWNSLKPKEYFWWHLRYANEVRRGRSPKCQIARRRWRGEACKLLMQTAISAREKKREALGETSSYAYQIILPIPPFLRLDFTKFSHRAPWANLCAQSGLCIWSHMRARGADWLECLAWYFLMLGHTHAHKHALA